MTAPDLIEEVTPRDLRCLDVIEDGAGQWRTVKSVRHFRLASYVSFEGGSGSRLDPGRKIRRRVAT